MLAAADANVSINDIKFLQVDPFDSAVTSAAYNWSLDLTPTQSVQAIGTSLVTYGLVNDSYNQFFSSYYL